MVARLLTDRVLLEPGELGWGARVHPVDRERGRLGPEKAHESLDTGRAAGDPHILGMRCVSLEVLRQGAETLHRAWQRNLGVRLSRA